MGVGLYPYQEDALRRMHNGCILCGPVGCGKSRTGLAYFFTQCGGGLEPFSAPTNPHDLYIITTAKKRDSMEWEDELVPFLLSIYYEESAFPIHVTVDSWNNIKKYCNVYNAFFIFDEDRVTGSGAWVKSFYKIANKNRWIILSATPGDKWEDYIPVFVANRFYRNKTEFYARHAIFNPYTTYRKVDRWIDVPRMAYFRRQVVVQIWYQSPHHSNHEYITADYDRDAVKYISKTRTNPFTGEPIENISAYCALLRRIGNTDDSRGQIVLEEHEQHPKLIVFYNFDYELDILRNLGYPPETIVAEWNGHKHEPIPNSDSWVYLVQYTSASEAWNTTETDAMLFFSESYSYKTMVQAAGRIDRVNSPFKELWYIHITSDAPIDRAIRKALEEKRDFNEEDILVEDEGGKALFFPVA